MLVLILDGMTFTQSSEHAAIYHGILFWSHETVELTKNVYYSFIYLHRCLHRPEAIQYWRALLNIIPAVEISIIYVLFSGNDYVILYICCIKTLLVYRRVFLVYAYLLTCCRRVQFVMPQFH